LSLMHFLCLNIVAPTSNSIIHLRLQVTATLFGSRICKSSCILVSFTTFKTRFLAWSIVSPFPGTGYTRWVRNRAAMVATNSTWANFLPGQLRTPSDQAKYAPFSGIRSFSRESRVLISPEADSEECSIHREGRQVRASSPQ